MARPSRPPLSRERVIDAAVEIVEREGAKRLTMRRLGEALGVEAMSVYEYVENKKDLVSAIAERLLEELRLDDASEEPWIVRIERVIREWARLARVHPRAFPLLFEPRRSAPKDAESAELILDALHTGGFEPPAAALVYRAMMCLLDGALLRQTSALPDVNAAWHDHLRWLDPDVFPRSTEVEQFGSALQPAEIIDAGINLIIAGLQEGARRSSS